MIYGKGLDMNSDEVILGVTAMAGRIGMKKHGTVTFKVDEGLFSVIRDIPNRSEFIRGAILAALGNVCPLCNGTGILTANQKQHWDEFSVHHTVKTCSRCSERHLVCMSSKG
jgi:hypothetical protein